MAIYRIRDWSQHFESAESRKLKALKWVAMPNKMNTQGYTALVDHPNGAAHFGAWCALVEICSAREPKELRGTLPESDGTIGGICRSLGRISRLPAEIFEELLPRLMGDPEIAWIEEVTGTPGESAGVPGGAAVKPDKQGRGGEGITGEGKGGEEKPPAPAANPPKVSPFPELPPPVRDWEARYQGLYDQHVIPGFQSDGRYEYLEIISKAVHPEKSASGIEKSHAEWMKFFREHPEEYRPGIGKWLKDRYYTRHPREPTQPKSRRDKNREEWESLGAES